MSTGAFTLADVDKPTTAAQTGKFTAADLEPNHEQPEGFWRTVYDRSGLGAIQKLSASLADWAQQHAETKAQENLHNIAQGGKGIPIEAYSPHAGYDLLSHGARMISSAFDPKSAALTAGVALANTNPVTGIPVDTALVAHGGYGVAKNAEAALGGNPDAVENALMSGAEMAGGAAGAASKARSLSSGNAAQKLYQSALKPSTALSQPARTRLIQTGLDEGVPVSQGGVEKISTLMDDLNSKIQDKIDAGTRQGVTVNKFKVASRLADTYSDVSQQVNPVKGQAAVGRAGNEFLASQPAEIPASSAQAIKQGTYQQIKKSYGQLSSASVESQKALARGIKEELAAQFPEIGDLNARESRLIGLDKALERAVGRIENHQVIGIGTPLAAAGAKAVTGSSGVAAVAGILKAVFDDPFVKSKLAISLNKASRGKVPFSQAQSRVAQYGAALAGSASARPPAGQDNE